MKKLLTTLGLAIGFIGIANADLSLETCKCSFEDALGTVTIYYSTWGTGCSGEINHSLTQAVLTPSVGAPILLDGADAGVCRNI